MSLSLCKNGKQIGLEFIVVSSTKPKFYLQNIEEGINFELSFPLYNSSYVNPEDYVLYILYHNSPAENDIFQLYEKKANSRIGWIFPISSIFSSEHEYATNKFFLEYANIAFQKLVRNQTEPEINKSVDYVDGKNYSLEDFYEGNSVVVLLSKSEISKIQEFRFAKYKVSLYKNGYSTNPKIKKINLEQNQESEKRVRVTISPLSDEVRNEEFVNFLILAISKSSIDPYLKFHLLYQIIELFIETIYEKKVTQYVSSPNFSKNDPHEIRENIIVMSGDQYRLNCLFQKVDNLSQLKESCIDFLKNNAIPEDTIGAWKKESSAFFLYKVRSILVHSYHKVDKSKQHLLESINEQLEPIVLEFLQEYRYE